MESISKIPIILFLNMIFMVENSANPDEMSRSVEPYHDLHVVHVHLWGA